MYANINMAEHNGMDSIKKTSKAGIISITHTSIQFILSVKYILLLFTIYKYVKNSDAPPYIKHISAHNVVARC